MHRTAKPVAHTSWWAHTSADGAASCPYGQRCVNSSLINGAFCWHISQKVKDLNRSRDRHTFPMEAEGVGEVRARWRAEHTPFFSCLPACHGDKRHFISIKTYSYFLKKYVTVGVSKLCSFFFFVPQQCTIPNDKKNRTEQNRSRLFKK